MPDGPGEPTRRLPFSGRATISDIYYCFRLLLGRYPNPEEWRGHAMRTGEDLSGVVASFTNSLEFSQRALIRIATEDEFALSILDGIGVFSALDDAHIGAAVRDGLYEPEQCALLRRVLRPGMHVLDVGANIGVFALLAASLVGPSGRVDAIEPNPRNARLMEASRRQNGFAHLHVHQVAAGRENGLLGLNVAFSNGTTSALPDSAAAILSSVSVPAIRIDQLLPPGQPVDFIKIDVEGAEYNALLGGEQVIRRCRPVIASEFSPGMLHGISGIDGAGFLRWLSTLGYDLSVIGMEGAAVRAGGDVAPIMRAYHAAGVDHIDILATPV